MPTFRTPQGRRNATGAAAAFAPSAALLTVTLLTGTLLAGCGSGHTPAAAPITPATPPASAASSVPPGWGKLMNRSVPTRIAIPKIGVSAPVMQLGLQSNGQIQVPPLSTPNLAGWYDQGPTPGEIGPSVIIGHVDANKRQAVFYRLRDLAKGDTISITRQDGGTATFTVERLQQVPKTSFPGQEVYAANLDYAGLRLVTCGGAFDTTTGHYLDNTIVYARLTTTS